MASRTPPQLPPRPGAGSGHDPALPAALVLSGQCLVMRALAPDDAGRLLDFFQSHTPETIRGRYGFSRGSMSLEQARQLVGIDQSVDAALGVFEGSGGGQRLVAIGRACRVRAAAAAEIAFVVREDRRRLGIATALFRALRAIMGGRGVDRLVAQVNGDNAAMRGLFLRTGGVERSIPGTGALQVEIPLFRDGAPQAGPPPAAGQERGKNRQAARSGRRGAGA